MAECNGDDDAASARRSKLASSEGLETILVVEDTDIVRSLTQRMLSHLGYHVLVAEGPDAAEQICDEHDGLIHLLLTDVVMPRLNGRELFDKLRRRRPELRVVYMSGYSEDEIAEHGVFPQRVAFLPKPFTLERLASKVKDVLEGHDSARGTASV